MKCFAEVRRLSLRNSAPQLQVPMVARPRNQLYLDHEVAGIGRPLSVSGRAQHSCQVALQCDSQLVAIALENNGLDQRTNRVYGAGAALLALQGGTKAP